MSSGRKVPGPTTLGPIVPRPWGGLTCGDIGFAKGTYCIAYAGKHRDVPIWKTGHGLDRFRVERIRLCTFHYNLSIGIIPIVSYASG